MNSRTFINQIDTVIKIWKAICFDEQLREVKFPTFNDFVRIAKKHGFAKEIESINPQWLVDSTGRYYDPYDLRIYVFEKEPDEEYKGFITLDLETEKIKIYHVPETNTLVIIH